MKQKIKKIERNLVKLLRILFDAIHWGLNWISSLEGTNYFSVRSFRFFQTSLTDPISGPDSLGFMHFMFQPVLN